jgi:hypothetical protein
VPTRTPDELAPTADGAPPGEGLYSLRRVGLTPEEERGYYQGLANEGLWPLCHLAHMRPLFRSEDCAAYTEANRKFAEAGCKDAESDDPVVLGQDDHFVLAPGTGEGDVVLSIRHSASRPRDSETALEPSTCLRAWAAWSSTTGMAR